MRRSSGKQDMKPDVKSERGVALMIVMAVIAVLMTVVVDFQYNSRVNLQIAANERDALRAFYLARSAVNMSRLVLHLQKQVDMMMQNIPFKVRLWELIPIESDLAKAIAGVGEEGWEDGVEEEEDRQGELLSGTGFDAFKLGGTKGFGDFEGSFSAQIEDENRKINVNRLAGTRSFSYPVAIQLLAQWSNPHYDTIFESPDASGSYGDRMEVLMALRDWIDADDQINGFDPANPVDPFIPSSAGAEDARYNSLEPPYENKNAKFDTVEELRMVKGVGDDFMEAFGGQLTVYPVERINVATAPIVQIAMLILACAEDPNDPAITNIAEFIKLLMMIQELRFQVPIGSSQAFMDLVAGLGVKLRSECGQFIDVTSSIFTVKAAAKVGSAVKTITCVMRNDDVEAESYLYWRED